MKMEIFHSYGVRVHHILDWLMENVVKKEMLLLLGGTLMFGNLCILSPEGVCKNYTQSQDILWMSFNHMGEFLFGQIRCWAYVILGSFWLFSIDIIVFLSVLVPVCAR